MTPKLAEYIATGKALDAEERLEAAHQLLLSVDQDASADQTDIEEAWAATIDRRVEEITSGQAELVDGPEGLTRIRAELAAQKA
jgi:TolB-like protein